MPHHNLHTGFNYRTYPAVCIAVRLIVPAGEVVNATAGVRTHVFDADEYNKHMKQQKVRYKIPDLLLFSSC